MDAQQKINQQKNKWQQRKLSKLDPENYRFKIDGVKNETVLAYHVDLEGDVLWIPKSVCEIGIEPGGKYYAIDIKGWYAKSKKIV